MGQVEQQGREAVDRPGRSPRTAYGAGHFAKSLAWTFTDLLLAYYVNVRVGLPAHETGLLLFLSMAYGAVLDPIVAYLLRGAEGSRRQILRIQFLAGLVTAAALVAVFLPRDQGASAFLHLVLALGLLRTGYAVYDVAQNALVSLLPADDADAHRYVVLRQTLSAVARICIAALSFLIVDKGAPSGREVLLAGAIGLMIVATASWILAYSGSAREGSARGAAVGLRLPKGAPRLLLAAAVHAGPFNMTARMLAFVDRGGPRDHTGASLIFALVLGTLIGPILIGRFREDVQRPWATMAYTTLGVAAGAAFLAAPRSGVPALLACAAYGVSLGATLTMFWRGMSAAIREHARLTGERTDLAAFATLTAALKLAGAVFGGAVGLALDGFRAGHATTSLALGLVMAIGGACFVMLIAPVGRRPAPRRV
ncbi:MFS transporter [uncultured Caulobacter sp.]|uniref:MFS transporter n=1 Tax=uncultured Caulobacter sp. TaxID=158749 RepID=UPI0026179C05|nr:MFS transporter [uncultured Caulobacter sp.]